MAYKVGDRVKIKTWDELVNEFGVGKYYGSITLTNHWYNWVKSNDELLPKNRVVIITDLSNEGEDYSCNIF